MPIDEAVKQAARSRFRAILLTSLTTFLGLAPIAIFETSLQAAFVIPMAVALGFAVLYATLVTLILVPCLYLILIDMGLPFRWIGGKIRQRRQSKQPPAEDDALTAPPK